MIVIVGESASGKSTLAKEYEEWLGFKRIVTYTTREPRQNEKEGVDYHFIDDAEFERLDKERFFAETAEYNGWKYGSAKKDYVTNAVAVLTPRGLRSVKRNGVKCTSIYLDVPRRDRLMKCLSRQDNIEEAYRRSLSDVGQFDGIEDEVDYVLKNPNYAKTPEELITELTEMMRARAET
jgi:guanylate kinase